MENADQAPARAFSWQSRADGTVVIRWGVAPVTLLRGRTAERFTARMATADGTAAQLLMARATGNFKRGNQREALRRGR